MPVETVTCPYCNARVPIAGVVDQAGRLTCPRCSEPIPFQPGDAAEIEQAPSTVGQSVSPVRRHRIRWVTAGLLTGMALIALLAVFVSLQTVPGRRARDPKNPLGYIPPDANLIATLRVRDLSQEVAGRKLLAGLRLGPTGIGLSHLESRLGLGLDDIETLVLAAKVDDRLIPRFSVIIQTPTAYDEDTLRDALPGKIRLERNQKTLYQFTPNDGGLQGTVWFAAASILVVGWNPADFDALPDDPLSGPEQLLPPLHDFLRERVDESAQGWVMAHADDWRNTLVGPFLDLFGQTNAELAGKVQTVGAWVQCDDRAVSLKAALRTADEKTAQGLAAVLTLLGLVKPDQVRAESNGWLTLQAEATPEVITRGLAGVSGRSPVGR